MMSFTPIGMPCSRPWRGPRSEQFGAFQCSLTRQVRPGEHLGVALVDTFEMGAQDRLGGHRPGIDPLREFGGGQRVGCGHDS